MRLFLTWMLVVCGTANGIAQEAKAPQPEDAVRANPPVELDFDLLPDDALAAFAVRDLSDLNRKMNAVSRQTKSRSAGLLALGVNMATGIIQSQLGLEDSFDESGSVAVAVYGAKDEHAFILPITNVAAVAKAFKFDEIGLSTGKLFRTPNVTWFAKNSWLGVKRNHVVLGKQSPVAKTMKSKGLAKKITKNTQSIFANDDLFGTIDLVRMNQLVDAGEINRRDAFILLPDDIIDLVDDAGLQRVNLGLSVDNGFDGTLLFDFESEESRQLLTKLQNQARQSNLTGLPVGKVVVATARNGGPEGGDVIRQATDYFTQNTGGFWGIGEVIAPQHIAGLVGILDEGINRVNVSRAALYRNDDATQNGAFSLIAILDADDGHAFVKDIQELVPIVNASLDPDQDLDDQIDDEAIEKMVSFLSHKNSRAREFMTAKLRLLGRHALKALRKAAMSNEPEVRSRAKQLVDEIESDLADQRVEFITSNLTKRLQPEFAYIVDFEQRAGQDVDAIRISLKGVNENMTGQLQAMLGPEWNKMRLTTVGDQVVVMLGSDTALFDRTIDNLISGSPGIEAEEHYANFHKRMPPELMSELHVSIAAAADWSNKALAENDALQGDSITSIGLSISPQQVQLDITIPIKEFDAWERFQKK